MERLLNIPALFSGVQENPFYLALNHNNRKFDTIIAESNFSQSIAQRSTLRSFKRGNTILITKIFVIIRYPHLLTVYKGLFQC